MMASFEDEARHSQKAVAQGSGHELCDALNPPCVQRVDRAVIRLSWFDSDEY